MASVLTLSPEGEEQTPGTDLGSASIEGKGGQGEGQPSVLQLICLDLAFLQVEEEGRGGIYKESRPQILLLN